MRTEGGVTESQWLHQCELVDRWALNLTWSSALNPVAGASSHLGLVPVQTCLPLWQRSVVGDPGTPSLSTCWWSRSSWRAHASVP